MPHVKTRRQILRMAKYVRGAVDNDEPEPQARARANRLEAAGRLQDDGSLLPVHQDEQAQ